VGDRNSWLKRIFEGYEVFRLPLPIDPRNPERGVAGMLKGVSSLLFPTARDPEWSVVPLDGRAEISFGDTPSLALLQALEKQWEVEDENKSLQNRNT
jgi:hypothetical protein